MSGQGTIKHVFPGANTPQGFYSLYDYIAPVDANKIFVIKGGPGVGKSTFMKKIAQDLLTRGFDLEFHHCSADNNSIDAIYIPAGDIAMLDGTAPHVVDPKHPGAVDEIINFGEYWNEDAMRAPANKEGVLRTTRDCSFRFKRANDCLKAAKAYLEEWRAYHTACLDIGAAGARAEELIAELLPGTTGQTGKARRLFASAITYDGAKHWLGSLFDQAGKRYVVTGAPGTGKSTLLGRLAETALARGYSLDVYHCPMYPEKVDHLYIRETDTAVVTSTWPHEYTPKAGDVVIDTADWLDQGQLAVYTDDIAAAKAGFEAAIQREMHHLGMAKKIHDEMETFYIPHMDFGAIEALRARTLNRILELIAERQQVHAQ